MDATAADRPKRLKQLLILFGLLALALTLRVWGLEWGVPNAERLYPYHPDEPVMLGAITRVNPLWGDFTPGFYNYGSFTINLTKLVYDLLSPSFGWGAVPQPKPLTEWVADFGHLLTMGRWLTVLFGAGTVLLTFSLGKRLYGEKTGAWGAVFLAAAPAAVIFSHYLTVDVPATFFTTLALLAAAAALDSEPKRAAGWILAGAAAAGIATGIKYNSFPAFFSLAVPLWAMFRAEGNGRRIAVSTMVGAVVVMLAAFFVATPGALLEPDKFREHVLYEMERNRVGQGLDFRATPPAALYHLGLSLPIAMEWPLYILAAVGLGISVKRRSAGDVLLWLFLIPSFLLLAPAERKFVRYVTPLLPPLCLLAAAAFQGSPNQDSSERRRKSARDTQENASLTASQPTGVGAPAVVPQGNASPTASRLTGLGAPAVVPQGNASLTASRPTGVGAPARAVGLALSLAALVAALASSVALVGVMAADDSRDRTAAWLRSNATSADIVALASDSWYYTPPIAPSAGNVKAMLQFGIIPAWETADTRPPLTDLGPYRVLAPRSLPPEEGALPISRLEEFKPLYVVISDFEWEDPERVRRAEPEFKSKLLDLLEEMERKGYRVVHEERPRPSLFGFTWWSKGIPPHDWRYFMPSVRVYERAISAS